MRIRVVTIFIIFLVLPGAGTAWPQLPSLTLLRRTGSFIFRTKPTKEQKKLLLPNARDLVKYQPFLMQPKTGIFRLMPDIGCTENINIVRADEICLDFIPESPYYSFREKEHTIEMLADIRLKGGYFISDGILSQGILVNLGAIEIEKVLRENEGLKFLSDFSPDPQGLEAQKQFIQLMRGVKVGNYEYKKALPIVENATYALRVIAYRGNIVRSVRGVRFDLLDGDKRIDLTLVFRVIRQETDGAVTIVWKEIGRREAPRIRFAKRGK